ncbi:MAG: hypothetical protein IOC63_21215 [Methylobacterium sp.]|jgi:polyhydroxybutyrate depolymerase|nr:hypothetical protein [Methylobacterium sp.]MCA3639099.1 hypothetical protein [Methylobacterium sp.]MCA3644325.1 hypothetical protein [Methylobacterium sp.]
MVFWFFFVMIAVFGGALPAVAEETRTILHQGTERRYLEYIPNDGKVGPRPTLIDLHGLRPPEWKNSIYPQLKVMADREGLLVLRPEAINFRWNYAQPEAMQSASAMIGDQAADDVGFLVSLIDNRVAVGAADPTRVYVTGDSRGGFMTFELMCRAANKIAAAGPFIGSMTEKQMELCRPAFPVPVMAINGTSDTNIFYDGWIIDGKRQVSTPEVMEFWRKQHGCTGQKGDRVPRREGHTGDPTNLWLIEWTGCRQEGAVKLYRVNGGGHTVPRLEAQSAESATRMGDQNHDISALEEFWKFASKFQR